MAVQRKIFISYRRVDYPDFADRIRDWFIQRYGRDNVFMDFDSIPPGVRFADHIRSAMEQSDAVIAVIGPRWVELLQERAAKFEDDFVRIELELALRLGKPITPICINSAPVPPRSSLPSDLRPLLDFNIAFIDRTNFYERIERIITGVEATMDKPHEAATEKQLSAEDYFHKAVALSDNSEQEIAYYTEAIRLNPQFTNAYYNRGRARHSNGDLSGAIVDYSEAIRLAPQYAVAYIGRGWSRYNHHDSEGAIADYDEGLRLDSQNYMGYHNRAIAHHVKGNQERALADYSAAIRLNPQFVNAYWGRGSVRKDSGDLKGALADYQQYLDLGGGQENNNQAHFEQLIRELQAKLKSQR